jgi:hypothetical protein
MKASTKTLIAATAAVLSSAAVATAAEAPVVSAQHTRSGSTSPVSVPGTGIHAGDKLPAGARLIYRDVTLSRPQQPKLTLKAPAGKVLKGLAQGRTAKVGFVLVGPRDYPGHRSVTVKAFAAPKTGGRVHGRIYALVK